MHRHALAILVLFSLSLWCPRLCAIDLLGVQDATTGAPSADASAGAQTAVPQLAIFRALFGRCERQPLALDPDQEAFWKYLVSNLRGKLRVLTRDERTLPRELENLLRLYVFFKAEYEDLVFSRTREQRMWIDIHAWNDGRFRSTTIGKIHEADLTLNFLGFYCERLGDKVSEWRSQRGIGISDLLLVYMLDRFPRALLWDVVSAHRRLDAGLPRAILVDKTNPSWQFNNNVAREIAKPISWENLGMQHYEGGFGYIASIHEPLARFHHEHPQIEAFIPVYGQLWAGANALASVIEGRDENGASASRIESCVAFTFHFTMAVLDVLMVAEVANWTREWAQGLAENLTKRFPAGPATAVEAAEFKAIVERAAESVPTGAAETVAQAERASGSLPRTARPGAINNPVPVSDLVSSTDDGFRLNRKKIDGLATIHGQPESSVLEDANREALAATEVASRPGVENAYLGKHAASLINGPTVDLAVDAVGVTKTGEYVLAEAKGANIEHGLDQLEHSMKQLGKERVIWLELVVPGSINTPGFAVENGVLMSQGKIHKVLGRPVHVVFTRQ